MFVVAIEACPKPGLHGDRIDAAGQHARSFGNRGRSAATTRDQKPALMPKCGTPICRSTGDDVAWSWLPQRSRVGVG